MNDTPQNVRKNLRKAVGAPRCSRVGDQGRQARQQDKTDEPMTVEFLLDDPTFENVALPYKPSLEKLGIDGSDPDGRFGAVSRIACGTLISTSSSDVFAQSLSPGNEQREYWGSGGRRSQRQPQHDRHQGPGRSTRSSISSSSPRTARNWLPRRKALDRVLLWSYYMVPDFHRAEDLVAALESVQLPGQEPGIQSSAFPICGGGTRKRPRRWRPRNEKAGSAAALLGWRNHRPGAGRAAPRDLGFRRSQISRLTSRISTMSIRMRRRAAGSRRIGVVARDTFDSFNDFILKGDPAQGLGPALRHADDARQ